jgi:fructokinase
VRLDAPTTLSLVGLDAQGVPNYAFYGDGCADRCCRWTRWPQVPPARPTTSAVLRHGGGAGGRHAARAGRARAWQRSVMAYDPNIRLNVEPDLTWRDTLQWMLPRTALLKVSDEDLALLYPGADPADLAAHWLAGRQAGGGDTRREGRLGLDGHGARGRAAGGRWRWSTPWAPATPSRPRC